MFYSSGNLLLAAEIQKLLWILLVNHPKLVVIQSCKNPEETLNYHLLPFHGSLISFCCLSWGIKLILVFLSWDFEPPVTGIRFLSVSCHWFYKKWSIFLFSAAKPSSEHISDLGGFAIICMVAVHSRKKASRYSWDHRLVGRDCQRKMGCTTGQTYSVSTWKRNGCYKMKQLGLALLTGVMEITGLKWMEWCLCGSGLRGVKLCFAVFME